MPGDSLIELGYAFAEEPPEGSRDARDNCGREITLRFVLMMQTANQWNRDDSAIASASTLAQRG